MVSGLTAALLSISALLTGQVTFAAEGGGNFCSHGRSQCDGKTQSDNGSYPGRALYPYLHLLVIRLKQCSQQT